MKENIKVLVIQGLHVFQHKQKRQLFENALGKENVVVEDLDLRLDVILMILFLILLLFVACFNVIVAYVFSNVLITAMTSVTSFVSVIILYYVTFRLGSNHIMNKALKRARYKIIVHNPDVVIGMYFGAVVAMNVEYKIERKPLILISPSIRACQKYTKHMLMDLSFFPYVLLINGSKDKINPLSICEKLYESIPNGQGRLVIIDDNNSYSRLNTSDIQSWVTEANYKSQMFKETFHKKQESEHRGKKFNVKTHTLSSKTTTTDEFPYQ